MSRDDGESEVSRRDKAELMIEVKVNGESEMWTDTHVAPNGFVPLPPRRKRRGHGGGRRRGN